MKRHEVIEIMIETINTYNRNLMAQSNLSQKILKKELTDSIQHCSI